MQAQEKKELEKSIGEVFLKSKQKMFDRGLVQSSQAQPTSQTSVIP